MTQKLLGNLSKGLLFIISAPAGTGKTTLVDMLIKEFPTVEKSVSFTTRKCRFGEIPGVDYHFIDTKAFEKKINNDEFLEYVKLYGYYYGTDYAAVLHAQNLGRHVVLVIDTQGALLLKEKIEAKFIFIVPPSLEELKRRLQMRRTESDKVIEERLEWAKSEMQLIDQYDYCIVNDELSRAYQVLRSILIAEEHRTDNNV